MRNKICLLLIVLAAACAAPAQDAKTLTREQFYQAYRAANDKFSNTPARREIQKEESFRDGKPAGTTDGIYEWAPTDRFRYLIVDTNDKGVTKREMIRIGTDQYCRTNGEPWKKSPGCGWGRGMGLENVVSSRYGVENIRENGKKLTVYRQSTIYKGYLTGDPKNAPDLYWEERIFVDENGALVREEFEDGVEATKTARWRMKNVYEYNPPGLRIEPPVK
ncbi:MAG: hypothetical protein JSS81_19775 [Acidobacteria bacterium]|nr:hypothetical protein [Acidobacteriota bacterium]